MNPTLITDLLTYALPSGFLAGAVTWLVSRRKRRNDMLADMHVGGYFTPPSAPRYVREQGDDLSVGIASKDHLRHFSRRFPCRFHSPRNF